LIFFLAQFIRQFDHGVPSARSNGLAIYLEIIDKVNLASLINGDLVSGTDAQTGVVIRTIVHETFASGGIGLLIERALDR